jgi:uncharacterized protein YjbI with pentapeptide repeats
MANQEHLKIIAKGVKVWNHWRVKNRDLVPDLRDADLTDANLAGVNLTNADLTHAKLGGANLDGAYLTIANLTSADLNRARLNSANMVCANLNGLDLSAAQLWGANLNGAYMSGANVTLASVAAANFGGIDLSTVKGLDTVRHYGPSLIGIDTIYRSCGQISEVFLRGAGIPENFIAYMKSLTGNAFDFYSCFISYSTQDQAFADRLHADLQARGVRCWFAPHDIQGGRKLHEQIDEAIRVYDKILLILSDASMNSPWVKTEIANARNREVQQKRQMLFPISLVPFEQIRAWKLFDADTGIDSAREIREYYVPDFSDWKNHDSYAAVFERLVNDLKAGPGEKAEAQPVT